MRSFATTLDVFADEQACRPSPFKDMSKAGLLTSTMSMHPSFGDGHPVSHARGCAREKGYAKGPGINARLKF